MEKDVEIEKLFKQYCSDKWGNQCKQVKLLSRDEMEQSQSLQGCYDCGIRVAQAIVGDKTYALQYNPNDRQIQPIGWHATGRRP